jgi:cell division septation protein DedD
MMEEQGTWKGHTFTLIVFTGIVVLCSIFFILGMLVGRQQGQKVASAAGTTARSDAKAAPKEDKPDFTFYDSVRKENQAALQPALAPSSIVRSKKLDPEPEREPEPAPAAIAASGNVINYQIGAVRKAADAQKLLDGVKKKGFRAFILSPGEGDSNPYYRVQVGPFTDLVEAEGAKKKLESEKYQVYSKK